MKDFRVLLIYSNKMMENLIPINMSVLSAVLKKNGAAVELFDTTYYRTEEKSTDEARVESLQIRKFDLSQYGIRYKDTDPFQDLRKKINDYKPQLIGLCVVEDTYKFGIAMLESIKDLNIPSIVGGVHAILSPDEVIAEDSVDMVCTGEGEDALVELCEKMSNREDYSGVEGIWVKKDGRVIRNKMRKLIDINTLPYLDFSIYEKERFYRPMQGKIYRMLPVEMERGCPFSCTYCAAPALRDIYKKSGVYFRKKKIEKVIDEIKHYRDNYGLSYVYFTAETFLSMNDDDFNKFITLYKDIKLPFWFQTRPETIDEGRIRALQEVNCNRISVGIESGNEKLRREVLNRRLSNEDIVRAFDILARTSLPVSVNNIIGFPDETRGQVFDTINLNRRVKADSYNAFIFTPYRGTLLREDCLKKGYIQKDAFSEDSCKQSILCMPSLNREEILGLYRTFSLYVKFPEEDFERIRRAEKFDEEGNRVFAELSSQYQQKYFK